MIFNVRVSPGASRNLVKREPGGFKVYLSKPAHDGLANEQLLKVLAGHFKVKRYQVRITKGQKARDKIVEITTTG